MFVHHGCSGPVGRGIGDGASGEVGDGRVRSTPQEEHYFAEVISLLKDKEGGKGLEVA